jgi:hypothetical protein
MMQKRTKLSVLTRESNLPRNLGQTQRLMLDSQPIALEYLGTSIRDLVECDHEAGRVGMAVRPCHYE